VSDSGVWVVKAGNAVLIIAGADTPAAEPKVLDLIAASPFGPMLRKAGFKSVRSENINGGGRAVAISAICSFLRSL
jgi:hypothetical protein